MNPKRRPILVAAGAIALVLIALALLLPSDTLAAWFKHRHHASEPVLPGAHTLRVMFVVLAVALVPAVWWLSREPHEPDDSEPWTRRERWTVIGLTLVGAIIRLPRLTESLWYDEIAAWREYAVNGPGPSIGTYFDPSNHIFHTLLTWLSAELVGADELGLRLPAFIFSLLGIPLVFGLARSVTAPRAAVWAALVAALAPVFVLEGVESRGYSMMIAASAGMTWLLLANLRNERLWRWLLYAIVAGLGIWAHMMTVWIPIAHTLWLGIRAGRRRDWSITTRGWTAIALAAVFTLTLYAPVLVYLNSIRGTFTARPDTPSVFGPEGLHTAMQLGGAWYWWSAIPGLTLAILGIVIAWRRRDRMTNQPTAWNLVTLALLGVILMTIALTIGNSWMYARFALFMMPGAACCIAIGLDHVWQKRFVLGMLALIVTIAAWITDLAVRPPKQPLRDAANFIAQRVEINEIVPVIALRHEVLRAYGGNWRWGFAYNHGGNLQSILDDTPNVRYVVVYYPRRVPDDRYDLLRQRGFRKAQTFHGWLDWNHGEVEIWARE